MHSNASQDPLQDDPTLANRFLAHQLTEEERTRLEIEMLADPAMVAELEATARFKVGLQKLRETGELDALLQPPRSNRMLFAIAAVLILGIAALMLRNGTTPPSALASSMEQFFDPAGQALVSSPPYAVLHKRSTVDRTEIELPPERQAIKFRILPRADLLPPYRVSLVEITAAGDMDTVGSIVMTRADTDGRITVFADSGRLNAGTYQLVVSGTTVGEAPDIFVIDAVRPSSSN